MWTNNASRRILAAVAGVAAIALGSCGDGEKPAPFSPADLTGSWYLTIFQSGPAVAAGTAAGWIRGEMVIDAAGTGSAVWIEDSSGGAPTVSIPYAIDGSGVVTSTSPLLPGFLGKMSPSKNLIVATHSSATGAPERRVLRIYQKIVPGTSFSAADLVNGAFAYHTALGGAAAGWEHGTATTDASGVLTLSARVNPAGPLADLPGFTTLSGTTAGVVTASHDPSWKGFVSADKALVVFSYTESLADHRYGLIVVTRSGGTYALGDIGGAWTLHALVTDTTGAAAWGRGNLSVGATGAFAFSSWLDSSGQTTAPDPSTFAVASDGTVTMPAQAQASFHGSLAPGKQLLVATGDGDVDAHALFLAVR